MPRKRSRHSLSFYHKYLPIVQQLQQRPKIWLLIAGILCIILGTKLNEEMVSVLQQRTIFRRNKGDNDTIRFTIIGYAIPTKMKHSSSLSSSLKRKGNRRQTETTQLTEASVAPVRQEWNMDLPTELFALPKEEKLNHNLNYNKAQPLHRNQHHPHPPAANGFVTRTYTCAEMTIYIDVVPDMNEEEEEHYRTYMENVCYYVKNNDIEKIATLPRQIQHQPVQEDPFWNDWKFVNPVVDDDSDLYDKEHSDGDKKNDDEKDDWPSFDDHFAPTKYNHSK